MDISTGNRKIENFSGNNVHRDDKSKDSPVPLGNQGPTTTTYRPPFYRAVVHNLPARVQSKKSILDILKEFPNVKYMDIKVLANGVALIRSKDPNIVNKLRVLKDFIKEPITITLSIPKEKEYRKKQDIKTSSDKWSQKVERNNCN